MKENAPPKIAEVALKKPPAISSTEILKPSTRSFMDWAIEIGSFGKRLKKAPDASSITEDEEMVESSSKSGGTIREKDAPKMEKAIIYIKMTLKTRGNRQRANHSAAGPTAEATTTEKRITAKTSRIR